MFFPPPKLWHRSGVIFVCCGRVIDQNVIDISSEDNLEGVKYENV